MDWLKRSTPCLLAIFAVAVCASAQSNSMSASAGGSGSAASSAAVANANAAAAADSDASIATPSASSAPSDVSPRTDPYSPFDSSNTTVNLRHIIPPDDPPDLTVMAIDSINQEDCGTWTAVGAHSATVSMTRLEVPGKARGVYQHACGQLKKKKMENAQHDAEKALDEYHNYPAAWVLLGQVYYDTSDMAQAEKACSTASQIDPGYAASYLCLAAIATKQQNWNEARKFSDHALLLAPLKDCFALYYRAEAAFHQQDLRAAERNALDAAGADTNHQMPEIELLLARIYSTMKKSDEATVQMRNYLKFNHKPDGPAAVDAELATIADPQ
jgi:Tfp pilus assembly protein PilF